MRVFVRGAWCVVFVRVHACVYARELCVCARACVRACVCSGVNPCLSPSESEIGQTQICTSCIAVAGHCRSIASLPTRIPKPDCDQGQETGIAGKNGEDTSLINTVSLHYTTPQQSRQRFRDKLICFAHLLGSHEIALSPHAMLSHKAPMSLRVCCALSL